jgi:hypothetical protein
MPVITVALSEQGLSAELSMDGEKVFIAYEPLGDGIGIYAAVGDA